MAWQLCSTASPHKEKSKHFCTVITAEGICMILTQPNSCDRHQGHTPDLQQSKDIAYYSTGSLHNDSLENDFCSSLSTCIMAYQLFDAALSWLSLQCGKMTSAAIYRIAVRMKELLHPKILAVKKIWDLPTVLLTASSIQQAWALSATGE